MSAAGRTVEVPAPRLRRWVDNFGARHGGVRVLDLPDGLELTGGDGEVARLVLPHLPWDGGGVDGALAHLALPRRVLVVAVRRGGYAGAARGPGPAPGGRGGAGRRGGSAVAALGPGPAPGDLVVLASKSGRRRVQGRTAAGGWSQQRYARRREQQADQLVEAVAGVARTLLVPVTAEPGPPPVLVTAGDRPLVQEVLDQPHLGPLRELPVARHLVTGDPDAALVRALPERVSAVTATLYPAPRSAGNA